MTVFQLKFHWSKRLQLYTGVFINFLLQSPELSSSFAKCAAIEQVTINLAKSALWLHGYTNRFGMGRPTTKQGIQINRTTI